MSQKPRVTFSVSPGLLEELDAIAAEWGVERAQLVAAWVGEKVRQLRGPAMSLRHTAGTGEVLERIAPAQSGTRDVSERHAAAHRSDLARPSLLSGRPDDDEEDVVLAHAGEDDDEEPAERPARGPKRGRLERAVDAAVAAQRAKGTEIKSERAYRAAVRKELEGNPERVEQLLAEASPPAKRSGWSFGRDPV